MSKKFIFVFVVGIVLALGMYFVYTGQDQTVPADSISDATSAEAIAKTVQDYYTSFSDCMKNPPSDAAGQVSVYCQANNPYGGNALAAQLDEQAKKGFVPVICAQNPPQSVEVTETSKLLSGNSATVILSEHFGENMIVDVTYTLVMEDDQWRITNILCPAP